MPNHIKPLCSLYVMLDDLIRLCVYRGVGVHRFGYFQLHKPNKWYQSIQVSDCSSWKHGHWLFRGRHGSVESCLDPFSRNHRVADCRFEVGHFEWVQLLHTRGRWCCSLSEEGCKEEISFQPLGPCEGKKVVDCLSKTKGRFLVLSEKDKGKVLMMIKKRKEKGERQHVLPIAAPKKQQQVAAASESSQSRRHSTLFLSEKILATYPSCLAAAAGEEIGVVVVRHPLPSCCPTSLPHHRTPPAIAVHCNSCQPPQLLPQRGQ